MTAEMFASWLQVGDSNGHFSEKIKVNLTFPQKQSFVGEFKGEEVGNMKLK